MNVAELLKEIVDRMNYNIAPVEKVLKSLIVVHSTKSEAQVVGYVNCCYCNIAKGKFVLMLKEDEKNETF
jgi:translation elongation factor EF-4